MVAILVVDRLELVHVEDDEPHLALETVGPRQLARQVEEHRAAVGQRRERVGQRVLLRLLEDDRVVDDGARLFRDALDQAAVILGVSVRLDVEQRERSDEVVGEEERADDRGSKRGLRGDARGFERESGIGVDERSAGFRHPAGQAVPGPQRRIEQPRRVDPRGIPAPEHVAVGLLQEQGAP